VCSWPGQGDLAHSGLAQLTVRIAFAPAGSENRENCEVTMPANRTLEYDVKVSGLLPAAGQPMPNGERPRWSPLSHTLIHGPTEAVLVDPPITVAQTAAVGDWIAAHGRRLAYIYITHWHADHWLGTSELVARFPGRTGATRSRSG
jgi:hypothetical protein